MKRTPLRLLLAVASAVCAWYLLREFNAPPSDEVLTKNFQDRRLAYERLRDLLLADGTVLDVADWGVRTAGSPLAFKPPVAALSMERYHQYLALLKETGGERVGRSESGLAEACVAVWANGFAGDTRHESVCWLPQPPLDLVATLAEIEKQSASAGGKRTVVFKHMESNWYLERDE